MIEYWLPGEAEVTIGPPGECIPAEDDGLTGSFSSVMYPGGGVSVIGKVALSGRPSGTADANSSRLGSSGCSIGISPCCNLGTITGGSIG